MPQHQILAGANHLFPAGTFVDHFDLDNQHNVVGNVRYQIGPAPAVTVPLAVNEPALRVGNVHGQQVVVTNLLPSSLYVVW